jgi:ABC-2 type transport system permease protein
MISRILNIAWKELLHLRKDRVLIPFFMLGAIGELTLLAWATSQPIDNLNMTIVDHDNSSQSAALVQLLDDSPTFIHYEDAEDVEAIYDSMDNISTIISGGGKMVMGIIIPEGYGDDVVNGERPTIQMILNGVEAVSSLEAERAATEAIFQQGMRERFDLEPEDYEGMLPQITVQYNEDLESAWYTLPAEMGLMFYMMTIAIAALAIARERELGTYEQLLVMPFRPIEVILGKALTPMMVGYALFMSMLFMTTVVFGVPLRGSLTLLLLLAVVYLICEMTKGVLLSMAARTQMQAIMLVFVVAMVDMTFSGYAVAVENMPPILQTLANFIPIHHFLVIVRGIMLKSAGLDVLWPHVLALVLIGSVFMMFTARQYRRYAG